MNRECGNIGTKWDLPVRAIHWSQRGHWNYPPKIQPIFFMIALLILGGCGSSPSFFFRPEAETLYWLLRAHPVVCRSLDVFLWMWRGTQLLSLSFLLFHITIHLLSAPVSWPLLFRSLNQTPCPHGSNIDLECPKYIFISGPLYLLLPLPESSFYSYFHEPSHPLAQSAHPTNRELPWPPPPALYKITPSGCLFPLPC